jgi:MFS family permease
MVARSDLMNAIALNSSIVNGARIAGPAVAGLVVGAIGEGWCFFVNGLSFLAVIAGLLAMRGLQAPPRRPRRPALVEIQEGFRFVLQNPPVRALMMLLAAVSLLAMPYTVLMPVYADRILGGGARTLGILMGSTGVGALAGALVLARRRELKGIGRWITAGTIAFGLALVGFAFSRSFVLSCALLVVAGFGMMVQMAGSNTLLQTMAPEALRGRVMAVYSMMFMGMAPLGALAAGSLGAHIGVPSTIALGGAICVLAGLVFGVRLPGLRGTARALIQGAALASSELAQEGAGEPGAG